MAKVLYIHGFDGSPTGSTAKIIKKYYSKPGDEFFAESFDLLDFSGTMTKIKSILNGKHIDTIVAHSFGAFYALALNQEECAKIVINPCMLPSVHIPILFEQNRGYPMDEELTDLLDGIEEDTYEDVNRIAAQSTFGIFAKSDELFSFKDMFKVLYGSTASGLVNYCSVDGNHRIDEDELFKALDTAESYFDAFDLMAGSKNSLKENVFREHYVNIVTKEDKSSALKYVDEIFKMLQKAYEPIGGILGLDRKEDLIKDSDFWKIDRSVDGLKAVVVYTFKRGGRKLQYCASDGTDEGKKRLFKIIEDDLRLIDREFWEEVSEAMECIYLKHGAVPLPIDAVKALMYDKEILEVTHEDAEEYYAEASMRGIKNPNNVEDGFHYKRMIGRRAEIKICVTHK